MVYLGISAVLTFLYYVARQHRLGGRVARSAYSSRVATAQDRSDSSFRPATSAPWRRSAAAIREQTRTLEIHRDDRAYATTVQNNNTPLFFLNLGLVFGAAVLGFLTYRQTVSDGKGEHPAIVQASRRPAIVADRRTLGGSSQGRAAESQARASIGRVEHLMTASPLAEWGAKADRLEGVIPLFRGENARLRGMDPASILAFAGKPSLSLPIVEAERGFPGADRFCSAEGGI